MTTKMPWDHQITMRLLAGELTHEQGDRAFKNPKAFRLSRTMATGKDIGASGYKYWGRVKTPRMDICYCWSTRRNEAGYFLGWREVYENNVMVRRDEWMARKNKTRLKEFMLRRMAKAMENGKTSPKLAETIKYWMDLLEKNGTLSKRRAVNNGGDQDDDED